MSHNEQSPFSESDAARQAMAWHGWGSPVGLGAFLISAGICALLVRYALFGTQ